LGLEHDPATIHSSLHDVPRGRDPGRFWLGSRPLFLVKDADDNRLVRRLVDERQEKLRTATNGGAQLFVIETHCVAGD